MDNNGLMFNLVIYLFAVVLAVPIFARLGLGSVLGYLVAGVVIGPWVLGLITNVEDILHFSEFGVVLLLFLIGLELEPRKLWNMRKPILGVGGLQMVLTAAILCGVALAFGFRWQTSVVAGLGLAISSTAMALQILGEKRLIDTPAGNTGFSILLFQDIAVIPIIALIPLLGFELLNDTTNTGNVSTPIIILVLVAIFVVGHFLLHHVIRYIASTNLREVFTALSLLLVCGIALIMHTIGVSMALGAFVAGVLMADSPYRHALESDIEPFKGLLLGLFFISVGMSMNFGLLFEHPLQILAITLILMMVKILVLYGIGKFADIPDSQRWFFPFLLSQGGEFAFVLFGFAAAVGAMEPQIAGELILAVAISMIATPLLMVIHEKFIEPLFIIDSDQEMDLTDKPGNTVIVIGYGRFGQIIGRLLMLNGIAPTLIDHNPSQLERVKRFGYKVYYGDALRLDVLRSAGANSARMIVLAMDNVVTVNQSVELIQQNFPETKIMVRAFDRGHAMELIDKQVAGVTRETFYSALEMGKSVLTELGINPHLAARRAEMLRRSDIDTLKQQVKVRHDENAIISISNSALENLEHTLASDLNEEESETR